MKRFLPRSSFRFSLRAMLLVMAVLGVLLGMIGWRVRWAVEQRQLMSDLVALGGTVSYNDARRSHDDVPYLDKVFALFGIDLGLTAVDVSLSKTFVDDLSPLAHLERLLVVRVKDTPVTDEEVAALRRALSKCAISRQPDETTTDRWSR